MSSQSARMLKNALNLSSMTDALAILQKAISIADTNQSFDEATIKLFENNLAKYIVMSAGLIEQTIASNDNLAKELQASKEETVAARQALLEAWMQVAEEQILIDDAKNMQTANNLAQCFARTISGSIDQALSSTETLQTHIAKFPNDPSNQATRIVLNALWIIKQSTTGFTQNMQEPDIGRKKIFEATKLFDTAKYFFHENALNDENIEIKIESKLPSNHFLSYPIVLVNTIQEALQNAQLHSKAKVVYAKCSYIDNNLVISISDDGCQINKDTLDKVFQPFFTTMPGIRPGIGLTRIKRLVSQAGGDVKFISERNGNSLIVTLPASIANKPK